MATTGNKSNTSETIVGEVVEANKDTTAKVIPAQAAGNPVETVEEPKPTLRERLNELVHNKRIIAGASSVALIAAAVLVVRKRNASDETEEENTSA